MTHHRTSSAATTIRLCATAVLLALAALVGCKGQAQEQKTSSAAPEDVPAYARVEPGTTLDRSAAKQSRTVESARQAAEEKAAIAALQPGATISDLPDPESLPADAADIAVSSLATKPRDIANPGVRLTLANGKVIIFELFAKDAPKTVAQFMKQVAQGYHDGGCFHRADNMCVQAGDAQYLADGEPWQTIPLEPTEIPFDRGSVGMARTRERDSATSQFFIVKVAADQCAHLNPGQSDGYCNFGQVLEGMDAVDGLPARELKATGEISPEAKIKTLELVRFREG